MYDMIHILWWWEFLAIATHCSDPYFQFANWLCWMEKSMFYFDTCTVTVEDPCFQYASCSCLLWCSRSLQGNLLMYRLLVLHSENWALLIRGFILLSLKHCGYFFVFNWSYDILISSTSISSILLLWFFSCYKKGLWRVHFHFIQ